MKRFTIEVNEKQLRLMNRAVELWSRLICGQLYLGDLQDLCCEAYEKSGQGKWGDIRDIAEQDMLMLQRRYWNLQHYGASYGLGYDKTADTLFDMHKVLDHAIYLSMPKEKQQEMKWTVMADKPMAFGDEPLIKVQEIQEK